MQVYGGNHTGILVGEPDLQRGTIGLDLDPTQAGPTQPAVHSGTLPVPAVQQEAPQRDLSGA